MSEILSDLPQAIADAISEKLPALRECKPMSGRFNLERLKAEAVRAPAVRVSLLGLRQDQTTAGPRHTWMADMAVFIVAKDQPGLRRDAAAANMAQAILTLIPDQDWEIMDCGLAESVEAQPIVNAGMEKSKASLWAVTWRQPIVLDGLPAHEPAPDAVYLGFAPDTGADHLDDYEQVSGDDT